MNYVITHKYIDLNKKIIGDERQYYKTLHVGTLDLEFKYDLYDNVGKNISDKNPYYCELTGLYWLWKNNIVPNDNIIGLCHYRRYFTTKWRDFLYNYFNIMPTVISYKKVKSLLTSYQIVVPKKLRTIRTVRQLYDEYHDKNDLDILEDILIERYPEYIKSFHHVMNEHKSLYGNMFVTYKYIFDKYCEWLFDVLAEVEKRTDVINRDLYQQRLYGFLSERLLQIWIEKNRYAIIEVPVFNTDGRKQNIIEKNLNRIRKLVKK